MTRRPVVVFFATALNAFRWKPSNLGPKVNGFVVVFIDGYPEVSLSKTKSAVLLRRRQQLPGITDGSLFEVVTEREVSVHLEESAVPSSFADLLNVEGSDALLNARGAGVRRRDVTGEIRDERDHSGNRKEQGGIVTY